MDRFIDLPNKIQKILNQHLKSNMDRFIVIFQQTDGYLLNNLKSNMDRFIGALPTLRSSLVEL